MHLIIPEVSSEGVRRLRLVSALAVLTLWGLSLPSCVEVEDLPARQRKSLETVFYRGNPLPPAATEQELDEVRKKVRQADEPERRLLTDLYGKDRELWVYATRDSDGDGILDLRVSDYYGKFMEGDTDLDGDGLVNSWDAEPYKKTSEAEGSGGLPPHLNWEAQGKPAGMVQIQRDLYTKYGITLVERTAEFTPELAQAVWDTVTRVYRSVFGESGSLSTLKTIATEDYSLLDPEDEEGASDFAQVLPAPRTLVIYREGIVSPPIIQLGFLAHEVAHNVQFSLDYDTERQLKIAKQNAFAPAHFHHRVKPFGWEIVPVPLDPQDDFTLFRPQYLSLEPYEYLYRGEPLEDWEEWLAGIYDQVGEERYLRDERITELHILGDYSLTGPWEWYADHMIAYVYLAMLDSLEGRCPTDQVKALQDQFQRTTIKTAWPYFAFANATGALIQDHLRDEYPLDVSDVAVLAETYLLADQPGFCD